MTAARSRRKISSSKKKSGSSSKMTKVMSKRESAHPLFKSYYHDHQNEFHAKHPNSKLLLSVFILCILAFFVVVYFNRNMYMLMY